MDERGKNTLPGYLEIQSGDTLYRVTSIFADKGNFCTLWEELIIAKLVRQSDCGSV